MIKIKDIVEKTGLELLSGSVENEIEGGYSSDLLSDVIGNTEKNDIWITLQTHMNIVAVANLKELSAIILVNKRKPDESTLNKAKEENITILTTDLPTFEVVGRLYEMGIKGIRN